MTLATLALAVLAASARAQAAAAAAPVSAEKAGPEIWAKRGSYPVRPGNDVRMLVDGQAAYAEVSAAMHKAKRFIYSTFSYGDADFLPVPETGETMFDLLRARRKDGVDVKLVIWQPASKTADTIPEQAIAGVNDGPEAIQARWDEAGGYLGWYRGVHNAWWPLPLWFPKELGCNHQKTYVMDDGEGGVVAFVGGINPVQSYWDTPAHDALDPRRVEKGADALKGLEKTPPLHDVFYAIKGPAVADVLSNFVQRYNGATRKHADATSDAVPPVTAEQIPEVPGGIPAQILRTIPPHKYAGSRGGDRGIKEGYLNAINAAGRGAIIYIENQYFFDHVIIDALQDAAERGAKIVAVLSSKPDEGLPQGKLESFMEWVAKGETQGKAVSGHQNVALLTLGNARPDPRSPDGVIASETYIHSKNLFVIDPKWAMATGGSANIAFTSMLFHAEENVAIMDPGRIKDWVAKLWAEHLQMPVERARALLDDPESAFAYFKTRSAEDHLLLAQGLTPPSRVYPFGTHFPARELDGISAKDLAPAAAPAAPAAAPGFALPGLGLADAKAAAPDAPAAPPAAPAPARGDETADLPRALDDGLYAGHRPTRGVDAAFLRDGLKVDTIIGLGEFKASADPRCAAAGMRCVDFPFDPAYARRQDPEALVAAFSATIAERAAGRTVYLDAGVDDERAAALEAALAVRKASCGAAADKDALWAAVSRTLAERGFRPQFARLRDAIKDWVDRPEASPWLCAGAPADAGLAGR